MVDVHLLSGDRRLRVLFLDFNAFFASCEQQEDPKLRGRPVVVAPMESDTTSAVAASYEAKRFGIKCGTPIWEARQRCPDLVVRPANFRIYKAYHEALRAAAQTVLPEEKVHSIDELSFRLLGDECRPENAMKVAEKMKEAIRTQVGECMTSSIGIGPNHFLAKLGTEVQKPNGLVVLNAPELPGRLLELKLTDFTGINVRMAKRLNASMIFTAKDLYAASPEHLREAFGGVVGERWWYLLRGYDVVLPETQRRSLGHSHVLRPDQRNPEAAREVLVRLLHKAASRLRAENLLTASMSVFVSGPGKNWAGKGAPGKGWSCERRFEPTQESVTLQREFAEGWKSFNLREFQMVGITFHKLLTAAETTPSLFEAEQTEAKVKLSASVDEINQRFGKHSIYLAGLEHARESGDEKIAFQKTWLFSEGKNDNEWVDTFRGIIRPGGG